MSDHKDLPSEKQGMEDAVRLRIAEKQHETLREHGLKINEAAATSANQALKTALLINGGAAVSMLAFIGGLVSNGKVLVGAPLAILASPLIWFAVGVALAGLATAFAYFTNYSNVGAAYSMEEIWESPWHRHTAASQRWMKSYYTFFALALLSGVASLGAFVGGMWNVRNAILSLAV